MRTTAPRVPRGGGFGGGGGGVCCPAGSPEMAALPGRGRPGACLGWVPVGPLASSGGSSSAARGWDWVGWGGKGSRVPAGRGLPWGRRSSWPPPPFKAAGEGEAAASQFPGGGDGTDLAGELTRSPAV